MGRIQDRENPCGVCGGPGVFPLPELVGFRAAADGWAAVPEPLDRWQLRALSRLIAAAA
jgi:hypothetical protein